ncbi:hypothetical protein NUW58_g33 [Xylaria curta]|uniref:Uncharacterized protein n=1 Tax=Xylaria curta TaxID=42375 RepID=A0ACC1PSI0_9PEZI|nr:hypothetical protein NUW58_g33 [Xylaria curta]
MPNPVIIDTYTIKPDIHPIVERNDTKEQKRTFEHKKIALMNWAHELHTEMGAYIYLLVEFEGDYYGYTSASTPSENFQWPPLHTGLIRRSYPTPEFHTAAEFESLQYGDRGLKRYCNRDHLRDRDERLIPLQEQFANPAQQTILPRQHIVLLGQEIGPSAHLPAQQMNHPIYRAIHPVQQTAYPSTYNAYMGDTSDPENHNLDRRTDTSEEDKTSTGRESIGTQDEGSSGGDQTSEDGDINKDDLEELLEFYYSSVSGSLSTQHGEPFRS